MTKITKLKSGSKLEDEVSFSRIVAVGDLLFVTLTAGRNSETKEIPEDVTEQTHQVVANIEHALSAVNACLADIVAYRVYIPDQANIPAVTKVLGERFRGIDPASVLTCCPLAAPIYKVEMEVTAYRGAATAEQERIRIGA